ncbi:peptidase inhibitor family I36 protein [Bounagaea algeriensis]
MSSTKFRMPRSLRAVAATTGATALAMGAVFAGQAAAQENQDGLEAMDAACNEGYLCIWDGPNGSGDRMDLYVCDYVNVREGAEGQAPIRGVGSFVNNQTDGTVTGFHGPLPEDPEGPPQHQYDSTAFDIRGDTTDLNTYEVQVC